MVKKISLFLMMMLLVGVIAACGSDSDENASGSENGSETVTVEHQLGKSTVTKQPETVVVFDFGALETLHELGVEVAGVAKDSLPSYLSEYKDDKYTNIGSLKEPDFEAIHGLNPDVILISGRQAEMYEDLNEIAPTVHIGLDTTKYMESFEENLDIIAQIFDKEDEVVEKLSAIHEKIDTLSENASSLEGKGLILLSNGGKISAYGAGSRFGILHDVFGIQPVDEDIEVSTHGMKVTFEYVLKQNPDYLFVIDRDSAIGDGEAAKEVIENELTEKTNAYKNNKIVYLDPEVWYLSGGGLISVSKMVDEISAAIE